MYVRREAVLSSQIEGTQSTLDDVLAFEIDSDRSKLPQDIEEVVNYISAMNYGLARSSSTAEPTTTGSWPSATTATGRAGCAFPHLRPGAPGPLRPDHDGPKRAERCSHCAAWGRR